LFAFEETERDGSGGRVGDAAPSQFLAANALARNPQSADRPEKVDTLYHELPVKAGGGAVPKIYGSVAIVLK
jgi:hypothetical protein